MLLPVLLQPLEAAQSVHAAWFRAADQQHRARTVPRGLREKALEVLVGSFLRAIVLVSNREMAAHISLSAAVVRGCEGRRGGRLTSTGVVESGGDGVDAVEEMLALAAAGLSTSEVKAAISASPGSGTERSERGMPLLR